VLYLGTDVLPDALIGPAVDRPDVEDPAVVTSVARVHAAVEAGRDPLEIESALAIAAARLRRHLGDRDGEDPATRPAGAIAGALRELLDERRFNRVTLADAGRMLHVSPGHLVRSFTRTFGIAPHRYVIGRRIDAARALLLNGEPIADVAVAVGFHDQAHLTKHFRRHLGATPGRFARGPGASLPAGRT
jgi:AraC-like DNA-binding protein